MILEVDLQANVLQDNLMPIFQMTNDDGETYHLEAPDEETAYKAFAEIQPQPEEGAEDDVSVGRRLSSSFNPSIARTDVGDDGESSLLGAGKAFGTGLANGTIKFAGSPGDVIGMGRQLLGDQSQQPSLLGSDHLRQLIELQFGQFYQPKGVLEEQAKAIGEAMPGALMSPHGSAVRALARVAAPAIADHLADQAFKGTPLESPARITRDALRAGSDLVGGPNMDLQQTIKSALLFNLWRGAAGSKARGASR